MFISPYPVLGSYHLYLSFRVPAWVVSKVMDYAVSYGWFTEKGGVHYLAALSKASSFLECLI